MTAWDYLRTTPAGELLTGTAHQSHPTDITASLGARFAGQTILAVHLALEKAATVRIHFDANGTATLSGIRNIRQRASAEFGETLRAEAAATKATWALAVFATGWQAVLGQRSSRPEPNEVQSAFARHRLMFESPEVVVPRAQVDRVYTAVDHPVLDKCVAFSLRRREVEEVAGELRKAGLGLAGVRITVAAQLEVWLATQGEAGVAHDLLLTDGLSALLLNVEQGDFVPPHGAVEAEQPRQSVQRPSAIEEDIARFIHAGAGRSIVFLGPEELCASVKAHAAEAEIVRPPEHPAHDTQLAVLDPRARHDLNFEAREVRPALPRRWRRVVLGAAALTMALLGIAAFNGFYALRTGYAAFQLERETLRYADEVSECDAKTAKLVSDFAEAGALRTWVGSNFHAQRFCQGLLREIPPTAAIDKLLLELRDGQITLTFVVLGDQQAQLAAHRGVERAIKELHFKIGGEELPTAGAGSNRSVQYRVHLIVPDAGEAGTP